MSYFVQNYPAPQVPARDAQGDETPPDAKKLLAAAEALGWSGRVTYSQGTDVDSSSGTPKLAVERVPLSEQEQIEAPKTKRKDPKTGETVYSTKKHREVTTDRPVIIEAVALRLRHPDGCAAYVVWHVSLSEAVRKNGESYRKLSARRVSCWDSRGTRYGSKSEGAKRTFERFSEYLSTHCE